MPRRRRTGACLVVLAALCLVGHARAQSLDVSQYAHTSWHIRDGFPKARVTSIAQTPDGYLWLGTELGLQRFDGVRATMWRPPDGQQLPSDVIVDLLVSRDSTVWIETWNGLVSWKDGRLTSYPQAPRKLIRTLRESRNGTIWLGSSYPGELCGVRQTKVTCVGRGLFGGMVKSLYEDASGNVWISSSTGVWRWSGGHLDRSVALDSAFEVGGITELHDGVRLLATTDGFKVLENGRIRDYSLPGIEGSVRPSRFVWTKDGALWISSQQGLFHVRPGRVDSFGLADGLSGSFVSAVYEDREGNVWVATNAGLDRFRRVSIPTVSVKQGLASDAPWAVQSTRDGSVWIAGPTALQRWNAGGLDGASTVRGASWSLGVDDEGSLLASTREGVARFDGFRWGVVSRQTGNQILGLGGDGRGGLWSVSSSTGLSHSTTAGESRQLASSTDAHAATTLLPGDAAGGAWIGYFDGGLSHVTADGRIDASYAASDGLGAGRITQVRRGSDGAIWAATEGGLSRVADGRIATLASKNGLPCDGVHWSIEDDDRDRWLYMACGLIRVARAEIDEWKRDAKRLVKFESVGSDDGVLLGNAFGSYSPRVTKAADGRIWFIAPDGVSVIDPRRLSTNRVPPPVHIERIVADDKSYDVASAMNGQLRLPPLIRDLAIEYTALSLAVPEKVRFRFKLEGQDREWREVVNQRRVEYSNLRPRNYIFRLTASNNAGVWNEQGTTLRFTVAPAFYQTMWFRALLAAGVAAAVWGAYRARIRQLRLREVQFQETIEAMPALAYIALPNGDRTFFNRRWMAYTGLTRAQALGTGWQTAVHPDDLNEVRTRWQGALATDSPLEYEVRLRGADGEYRWFFTRAVPVTDKRGQITKWYGLTTDVEERKRADEALAKLRAELAHATRVSSLATLTASIAHEVNQPLTGIITNASTCQRLLAAETPNIDGAREVVRRLVRDGNRASDVVTRLRALFSRKPPAAEHVDLNEATREVIALSWSDLQRARAALSLELASDLPLVIGDRVQLQQVIINLLRNACDALQGVNSHRREIIIITARDSENGDGDRVCLSVRDSGVGFGAERPERLFDAFYTTKPEGMGIGLSVCRSIIENHRGRLWAVSNDGPGATVAFSIPTGVPPD